MELRELARNVYLLQEELGNPRGDSNTVLVVGDNSSLVIDADIRRWEVIGELIKKTTDKPVRYVINTHNDMDHVSANSLVGGDEAVIISSETCYHMLAGRGMENIKKMIDQDPLLKEYAKIPPRLPNLTVTGKTTLYLGGHVFEMRLAGHGHTPGDLVVHLKNEDILFLGDLVFNGNHPVTRVADIDNWLDILSGLADNPVKLFVPGHGAPSNNTDLLENQKNYFLTMRSRAQQLKKQGLSLEQVSEQAIFKEFENLGRKERFQPNLKKTYEKLG